MLTIFTPTYNRAKLLHRLYQSLCRQTSKDFEWLIVDDGSTDDTRTTVNSWISESRVLIRYIYQANGGKMRAHNKGVENSKGELFICVDSDDYLVDFAVEKIQKTWKTRNKKGIIGIIALKGLNDSISLGKSELGNKRYSSLSGLYKQGFKGDATLIFDTKLLKKYPFPEISGEKFITEKYVYDQIDQQFEYIVLNEILTICEYLEDGYSRNSIRLFKENPKGWVLYYNQCIKLSPTIRQRFLNSCRYVAAMLLCDDFPAINKISNKVYAIIAFPFGFLLYLKRIRQFKKLKIEGRL